MTKLLQGPRIPKPQNRTAQSHTHRPYTSTHNALSQTELEILVCHPFFLRDLPFSSIPTLEHEVSTSTATRSPSMSLASSEQVQNPVIDPCCDHARHFLGTGPSGQFHPFPSSAYLLYTFSEKKKTTKKISSLATPELLISLSSGALTARGSEFEHSRGHGVTSTFSIAICISFPWLKLPFSLETYWFQWGYTLIPV